MSALPSAITATASTATEGDVKNYLIGLRDFLNGLFGATGEASDARAVLGVSPLNASTIATALGYTPANSSHSHAYAPTDARQNVVGGLAVGYCQSGASPTNPGAGTTYTPSGTQGNTYLGTTISHSWLLGFAVSGTWRCIGSFVNSDGQKGGLFQRIA